MTSSLKRKLLSTRFEDTWQKIKFKDVKYLGVKINVDAGKYETEHK